MLKNHKNRNQRKRNQRGAAMLESALVFSTFMFMILFIMEAGRFLMVQQFAVERAREVARLAVVNSWNSDSVANYFAYGSTTAPSSQGSQQGTQTAQGTSPGFMGLLPSEVSYSLLGTAGTPTYRAKLVVSGIPVIVFIPLMAGNYAIPPVTVVMPAQSLGATN